MYHFSSATRTATTHLGAFIQAERLARGWSQTSAAQSANLRREVVLAVEAGDPDVPAGAYVALLGALGLSGAAKKPEADVVHDCC